MEVQEGALEELGVTWNLSRRGVPRVNPNTGAPIGSRGPMVKAENVVHGGTVALPVVPA